MPTLLERIDRHAKRERSEIERELHNVRSEARHEGEREVEWRLTAQQKISLKQIDRQLAHDMQFAKNVDDALMHLCDALRKLGLPFSAMQIKQGV